MLLPPFLSIWSPDRIQLQFVSNAPQRRLGYAIVLFAIALAASLPGFAVTRAVSHTKVHRGHAVLRTTAFFPTHRGHYQVGLGRWSPMFPGSHDMLVRENEELDRLQLPRIADEYELTRYELAQELVPVSELTA